MRWITLIILTFRVLACPVGAQTTWHVDASATPPGSGTQLDPFSQIQAGILAASPGDIVLVMQGSYFETIDFLGKGIRVVSADGAIQTIIDASQADTVVTMQGLPNVIEGFTLTNGLGQCGHGGGVHCAHPGGDQEIRNCIIANNVGGYSTDDFVEGGAGGVHLDLGGTARLINCIIVGNTGGEGGASAPGGVGGVGRYRNGMTSLTNCTIADNLGGLGGSPGTDCLGNPIAPGPGGAGGVEATTFSSSPVMTNGIVSGNSGGPGGPGGTFLSFPPGPPGSDGVAFYVPATISWSNIQGGYAGAGNIDLAPQFRDATNGDYRLQTGSPCRNGGDNLAPDLLATDFEGDARILEGLVDMGADEFVPRSLALGAPPTASIGSVLNFTLSSVSVAPGTTYLMDVSLAGDTPGVALPPPLTGTIPLNPPFLATELGALAPGLFNDFTGSLDFAGSAGPFLTVPQAPQLVGIAIYAAAVTLEPGGPYGIGLVANGTSTLLGP